MEYIKEFEINEIHTELENYLEVLQESYKNKKSSMFNNNKKKAQNITKAQKALFKLYNTELTTEEQEAIKAKNEMDEIFRKIKYFEKDTSKIDKIKTSLSKERSQNIQNISKTIEKLENEINKYLKNIPIDKPITISKTETIDGKRIKININTKAQEIKSNTNNIYKHHSEDYYAIEFEKNGIYVQDKFSNALNKLISIKKKEYNQTIYADSDLKSIKKIETQKKNKELMIKIEKLLKEQKIDKESGITYNQINEINKQIEKLEEIDNKIILLEQAETLCRNNNKIYPNSLSKIVDLKKDYLKEQKEINNQLENLKIEDIEKIVTEKEEQELKDNPNISEEEALKEEKKY
jgi:hypothetical protein